MNTINPWKSPGRGIFLLIVGPAVAFLAFSLFYNLGVEDYSFYQGISDPIRVVEVR